MPNTPLGLPYPAATDPVSEGAHAIELLAKAVDNQRITGYIAAGGGINRGTRFTLAKGTVGLYTVNFTTPYAASPLVLTQIVPLAGGNYWSLAITALSAASFTVEIRANNALYDGAPWMFLAMPMV